ncbi:hypothetical protein H2200_008585 [Cladophialophora chaetospira]|uniref:CAP-Gly domain-containing protein n=1 Tax=Cladophialophora chaetospira TaxID=386627 RepID=A0AA39CFU3_9EURO|nr:hypothetical protein H2200_008585 [Cladophialophora chaetospira]
MAFFEHYISDRRSYDGALCTVRYVGPLPHTEGEWLGVEWDDTTRGKHDGQHKGRRIFRCLSSSQSAASFLRSSRKPDPERALLEAIKFKYAPTAAPGGKGADGTIEISGKVVEEVGFEKIQKQLSVLADLKIVLADELVVSSLVLPPASEEDLRNAQEELGQTCPNIVELDIGWNVIGNWQDVVDICNPLMKLRILKAGGLRLRDLEATVPQGHPLRDIEELHLNENLLTPSQILEILFHQRQSNFDSLRTLVLSHNELESLDIGGHADGRRCSTVTTISLENNKFKDLSFLPILFSLFPNLASLSLQGNAISQLALDTSVSFPTLETLNLAGNKITDYSSIDSLPGLFPNLTSLRISRNPLYLRFDPQDQIDDVSAGTRGSQAPSAIADSTSYYLTLARLPGLKSLNYTNITPRDREEGEIYYLSVAEKEIRSLLESNRSGTQAPSPPATSADEKVALARQKHPTYSTLCAKYDREDIFEQYIQSQKTQQSASPLPAESKSQFDTYAPGTLGSRLVDAYFYICTTSPAPEPFQRPLPTTISVYRLKSLVARHFDLPAHRFKLIYESHEYDPVEPIHSTRNTGAGTTGSDEEAWAGWGDWDVDNPSEEIDHVDADVIDDSGSAGDAMPKFMTREGHRFRKRETEILDGMRPWGDFLDVDINATGERRRRDVRVRVEPHEVLAK